MCGSVYVYKHYTGFDLVRRDGRESFPPPKNFKDLAPKKNIVLELILPLRNHLGEPKIPNFFEGHVPRLLETMLYTASPPNLKV